MKMQIYLLLTFSMFSCASDTPHSPTGNQNNAPQRARDSYIKMIQKQHEKCKASQNSDCAELFDNFLVVINSPRKS